MATILHYIYDPLCGWCYGAAPLVKAAREVLGVIAHGGGMMTGTRRQSVTPQLREFIKPHDARIAQLSGQRFSEDYRDGLLSDTTVVFDSAPPTAAILAAEAMAGRGLDMLAQLQIAHYVEGRRVADRAVLIEVASSLGLDPDAFSEALRHQSGDALSLHFQETRAFMAQIGVQGFPSFVLEVNGIFEALDFSSFLGRPQDFQVWLCSQTGTPATPEAAKTDTCDANGCGI